MNRLFYLLLGCLFFTTWCITASSLASAAAPPILYPSVQEYAQGFSSFSMQADSHFIFSQGTNKVEQNDRYLFEQDPNDAWHIKLSTSTDSVESYLFGDQLFVRQGNGKLRKKPQRELEHDRWAKIAVNVLHSMLSPFAGHASLKPTGQLSIDGLDVNRYQVNFISPGTSLKANSIPLTTNPPVATSLHTEYSPVAGWRKQATPLDLQGELLFDSTTGLPIKVDLTGRMEIADRDVRGTMLTITLHLEFTQINTPPPLEPQKAQEEYQRNAPPRDPLAFFREHMPKPVVNPDSEATEPTE